MRSLLLVAFLCVAVEFLATANAATCYKLASRRQPILRYRQTTEKYYYSTFLWGWIRKSGYRTKTVSYQVTIVTYYRATINCPVDGGWTSWKQSGSCSKPCGTGVAAFQRTCTNPKPAYGGKYCSGSHSYTDKCNTQCCKVDGRWSEWTDSGSCSKKCGGGVQEQVRTCTGPAPACGGKKCTGKNKQMVGCNFECCPVDGGWTVWEDSVSCSRTCGGGFKEQVRTCTQPLPECGGKTCKGENTRIVNCNTHCCPVDGGWSEWQNTSVCTQTCGSGIRFQNRTCTNPPVECGGASCIGNDHRVVLCNTACCPVDGGWSDWEDDEECSEKCGGGVKLVVRNCSNPEPSCGGKWCEGDSEENKTCNAHCCPVDGGWTEWVEGNCSASCGGGVKDKFRSCTNPEPLCGGKECTGSQVEIAECNEQPCEDVYGEWSDYTKCSTTCGQGVQYRTRTCVGVCENATIDYRDCNEKCCPVDGGWAEWKSVSECSVTCGEGVKNYSRSCTNPAPSCGGLACSGPATQTKECILNPCPPSAF